MKSRDILIETADGRLFARRWTPADVRDAVPIVLFHDSLGCVALWRDFPERLAAATGREVIAYDRLGFGRSDAHPHTLDAGFVHGEAHGGFRALREALRIGPFVAFGHSVGGGMAIACAAAWPDDCRALVTESAQAFVEERTVAGIVAAREAFAQPGQLKRLQRHHGDKAGWVLHAWIDTWLSPAFARWNLDDALQRVRCAVLAIHGDRDEYGSVAHPQRIAAHCTGRVDVDILADVGHVPHRERSDDVIARVAAWLHAREG